MRIITAIAVLATVLPSGAYAADKCGPLVLLNKVQMTRTAGADLIPVSVNGVAMNFIFDTGGFYTQISRPTAEALKLPMRQGGIELFDVVGHESRDEVRTDSFVVGHLGGKNLDFPVGPLPITANGLFALDHWMSYDLDVDFGTDVLNMFSQDHCPGAIQYWTAPALAVVPITMDGRMQDGGHIMVPVMLDGHEERAVIDTGAVTTSLQAKEEQRVFNLDLGSEETPEVGNFGDPSLKVYSHIFNSLSFGDVAVNNPRINIIPSVVGKDLEPNQLVGDRAKTEKDRIETRDLIIGMDVLRKLHIYMALGENKMYITQASAQVAMAAPAPAAATAQAASPAPAATPPTPAPSRADAQRVANDAEIAAAPAAAVQAHYKMYAAQKIAEFDHTLSSDPNNMNALVGRCTFRATTKSNLDAAMADCDMVTKLRPTNPNGLNGRALILYQQGKYQDALDAYSQVLKINPYLASALFMRGHTKGKLGDQAGEDADIAAAKIQRADIDIEFKQYDISY